nr:MAG TPA: hypothetical protein [Caudoviricetes sp.]
MAEINRRPLSLVLIYPQISASSRLPLDCNTFSR